MGEIYGSITELIGNTPLLELKRYNAAHRLEAKIVAKMEAFNPAGSAKDRVALAMLEDAEERGLVGQGSVIIEPTSGNTGIGLACIAAAKGYRAIIVMPESMSLERRKLVQAYGAELVLTEAAKGMKGAVDKADELARETPGGFIPGQFVNPANTWAHYRGTGPEIWRDSKGELDIFVAGLGTGGALTGIGRYLKEQKPGLRVVAVEPAASPVFSGGQPALHKIQGIGPGFIPEILDRDVYDEIITVEDEEAYAGARELVKTEGVLAGISSGAVLRAATQLAGRPENRGKTIVVLMTDGGERYLSTPMFDRP